MEKERTVELVAIVASSLILLYVTIISVQTLYLIEYPPAGHTPTIKVVGHQWYWEFIYPDGSKSLRELKIKSGEVYKLEVTSGDVIHSFFVYDLGVKIDAVPGRMNQYWIQADHPGEYLIVCTEYCGLSHYAMQGKVIVTQ